MRHLPVITVTAFSLLLATCAALRAESPPVNLALVATATMSFVSGHESIHGLNSGFDPRNSNDKRHGAYGNWPQKGTQWVEYTWSQPIHTGRVDVYWFDDRRGVRLPKACRLLYDDGGKLLPVKNAKGLGLKENEYNTTTFDDVHTTRLRLEMDSSGESTGILQWRVIDAGGSPEFPPQVTAGPDRAVIQSGKTWLNGTVHDALRPRRQAKVNWSKVSGPGDVAFENASAAETTASFSAPGSYVLKFTAGDDKFHSEDTLHVEVIAPPPAEALRPVTMSRYTVTSPLLSRRLKQVIIHWIPHCYEKLSDPRLPEGGIENFVQAANKLAGRPAARHRGAPWANAYTHNTVESMCLALMYDPQGDAEIIAAQDAIRAKLDEWIPKILAAQQPNGYLQTMYTLNGLRPWTNKGDHEGYTAGYFIEAAIAHHLALGAGKTAKEVEAGLHDIAGYRVYFDKKCTPGLYLSGGKSVPYQVASEDVLGADGKKVPDIWADGTQKKLDKDGKPDDKGELQYKSQDRMVKKEDLNAKAKVPLPATIGEGDPFPVFLEKDGKAVLDKDGKAQPLGFVLTTEKSDWVVLDDPMLRAARKLADCWYDHIGPAPKKTWYDGHEELEQALERLANLLDAEEGPGKGDKYFQLAKFLLESRRHGEWYDQSHLPVVHQYEAAGHAVRASYLYSGMAGVAMKTGDMEYQSALASIWHNIVDKRYYIIGGIGSGETSEGFGANYSLPNNAYCESCANCGLLFFENKMGDIWHDARYSDLAEDNYYNAILGDVDLLAKNFTYTNELNSAEQRYPWHVCPCCVGNIPRTLLELPIWMYSTGKDSLYVNMYAGSKTSVDVGGTKVEIEQKTDYPWSGKVTIIIRPAEPKEFSIHLRMPMQDGSRLYTSSPTARELNDLIGGLPHMELGVMEHGEVVQGVPELPVESKYSNVDCYRVISRKWKAGEFISIDLPLYPQRIKADERIAADRGRVALRYGPLIYCIESVDQNVDSVLPPDAPLTTEWRPDLLDGVVVIRGKFADRKPMLAIPYYARANRGGRYAVWIRDR